MARPNVPTIPDDKINYFKRQLFRELSHMFEWQGLPQTVPQDYLERNLMRHGYVMFYENENIGLDVLRAEVTGYNRHELPTRARTYVHTTNSEVLPNFERNVKRLADSEQAIEDFKPLEDCVIVQNMTYGESVLDIVDHFAKRLALAQQSFDTNLMWTNLPYIFQTDSNDTKLSIEKMFAGIFSGKPFIIADKSLFLDNADRTGVPTNINFIGKELMDVQNEIMMKFKQTVGFNTAGVDKAERVNTLEIQSNDQHNETVLQIMLEQRQLAVESINAFYGTNISVNVRGVDQEDVMEGGEEIGTSDDGTEEITSD